MSNPEVARLSAQPTTNDACRVGSDLLLGFLQYQRTSVLSIVEGLSETAWHTSVVPSGWTPAGLVEHLASAERHWFQGSLRELWINCRGTREGPRTILRRPRQAVLLVWVDNPSGS
jgi:hypothetical protein